MNTPNTNQSQQNQANDRAAAELVLTTYGTAIRAGMPRDVFAAAYPVEMNAVLDALLTEHDAVWFTNLCATPDHSTVAVFVERFMTLWDQHQANSAGPLNPVNPVNQ